MNAVKILKIMECTKPKTVNKKLLKGWRILSVAARHSGFSYCLGKAVTRRSTGTSEAAK